MSRRKKLYEGKAKTLFEGPEPGTLVQHFKDDTTAFNNKKHAVISGKGILNNRISSHLMSKLEEMGIPTHYIRTLNMREQLVREVEIIPVEVVVRNLAAGSLSKRLGIEEGKVLPHPILEYYYKNDTLGDPMVTEEHILAFDWASPYELEDIMDLAIRINDFLCGLFTGAGLRLIDLKMEFGRIFDEFGNSFTVLADEISPDTCRIWDSKSGKKLDKDVFRNDLGSLIDAYQEIARRLGVMSEGEASQIVKIASGGGSEAEARAETETGKGTETGTETAA